MTRNPRGHWREHRHVVVGTRRQVRMMYTLALGAGSDANQLVARNALLQMVVTAFKRMEAELAARPVLKLESTSSPERRAAAAAAHAAEAAEAVYEDDATAEGAPSSAELTRLADQGDIGRLKQVRPPCIYRRVTERAKPFTSSAAA